MSIPTYTLEIKLRKDGLTFKYGVKRTYSFALGDPIHHLSPLPHLLSPVVEKISALPLDVFNLELKEILPLAILESPVYGVKYLTPLDSKLILNHWDPMFQSGFKQPGFQFYCCKLDDYTIVSFQQDEVEKNRYAYLR